MYALGTLQLNENLSIISELLRSGLLALTWLLVIYSLSFLEREGQGFSVFWFTKFRTIINKGYNP